MVYHSNVFIVVFLTLEIAFNKWLGTTFSLRSSWLRRGDACLVAASLVTPEGGHNNTSNLQQFEREPLVTKSLVLLEVTANSHKLGTNSRILSLYLSLFCWTRFEFVPKSLLLCSSQVNKINLFSFLVPNWCGMFSLSLQIDRENLPRSSRSRVTV